MPCLIKYASPTGQHPSPMLPQCLLLLQLAVKLFLSLHAQLLQNILANYLPTPMPQTRMKPSLNYSKMHHTGTCSAPLLCSSIPSGTSILNPRISFHVKDTAQPHVYELQGCTCANGNKQQQFIDFTDSYSPVGTIHSIHLLLTITASQRLTLHILDITNAFQSSIIFDPEEHVYISLPLLYLDWFCHQ
jgi:hypothetical protein